jgi:hypothetical protein
MMAEAFGLLALALLFTALISAFGAITSRSLFATCMYVAAAAAAVATTILLLGVGNGALAVALVAAGWTPVLLLAATLLSARATKNESRGVSWVVSLVIGATALLAMWWPLYELTAQSVAQAQAAPVSIAFWLAPLLLAAVAGVAAVLGYGERGALGAGDGG